MNLKNPTYRSIVSLIAMVIAVVWSLQLRAAEKSEISQRTFSSPVDATNALIQAVKIHDEHAVREIFGPEGTNLLTGDKALDERHFQTFATNLEERCVLVPEGNDKMTLQIGEDLWPFPIPLIQTNGTWMFDTIAGEDEIIDRHIGRDEYHAIGVCRAYVKAQREYAARETVEGEIPRYARRFRSTPGKIDGLYWAIKPGGKTNQFSSAVADAMQEDYHRNPDQRLRPYHGYFFKILTQQGAAAPGGKMNYLRHGAMTGGFALLAYPIRWGESGIMTFIVNQDGMVYQRSLGEKTAKLAAEIKEYNPDKKWTEVQDPGVINLIEEEPSIEVKGK